MRREEIVSWIILAVIIALIILFVRYFWWLILIIIAIFVARYIYVRHKISKQMQELYNEVNGIWEEPDVIAEDSSAETTEYIRPRDVIEAEYVETKEERI